MKIELFYDKECPFCNSYANYIKLKEKHQLLLINAREYKSRLNKFKDQGYDINNGFIISIDDGINIYQGVDALVFLNKLAEDKFYFPDNYFFRDIIYPIIKKIRVLILFITRKNIHL